MKFFPSSFKIPRLGKKVTSILISILVFIIVITIYNLEDRDIFKALRIFKAIKLKSMDVRFQLRGKRDPGSEIVIVAIDENSIKKLGRYPWPRRYIAQFVDKITDAKARLLVLDVMYAEKQNVDILETLDTLAGKFNNSQLWNHLPGGPENEKLLTALHKKKTKEKG
ncbi:MAG: CHASE2 domain-containing protein [Candidatus Scalindua sp.]